VGWAPSEESVELRPEAYSPWNEPPPSVRGVTGLVRDAQTKAPIEGAWLAWRLPPPEVVERVLGDLAFRDPRFPMVTGADGTFAVERLPDDMPISATLYAVALGYAHGSLVVGDRREVVFELSPVVGAPSASPESFFVSGSVSRSSGNVSNAQLEVVESLTLRRHAVRADGTGQFQAELPRGDYVVLWLDGLSERQIGALTAPSAGPAHLDVDAVAQERFELSVSGGTREDLGLVAVEPFGSAVALKPTAAGVYTGHAPAGRYLVFAGSQMWGEVEVPGSVTLSLEPREVVLRFRLPPLDPDEVLRGVVSVVPAGFRADLRERFLAAARRELRLRSGASLTLRIGRGPHTLVGLTDCGPFEVDVPSNATEVIVDLGG
jgi:hypothetical protein